MNAEPKFYTEETVRYELLPDHLKSFDRTEGWVYRGQYSGWELETTLERYCKLSMYPLKDAPGIESEMIRNFQRLYNGDDHRAVIEDRLYCISVMRHYGAPSRVLDFTYSKDVATYFGLECAFETVQPGNDGKPDYEKIRSFSIWCVDAYELNSRIKQKYADIYPLIDQRKFDESRNDTTFVPLYMKNSAEFVSSENPVKLHQRLDLQHGVFLCQGNVGKSFMENMGNIHDGVNKRGIIKINVELNPADIREALEEFRVKTITRQSLLPGLDGFAQSMRYKFELFKTLYERRKKDGAYPG